MERLSMEQFVKSGETADPWSSHPQKSCHRNANRIQGMVIQRCASASTQWMHSKGHPVVVKPKSSQTQHAIL